MSYKIRKSEWRVLFYQLVNSGKSKWEAGEIIENHKKKFNQLLMKLKKQGKSEEQIEIKFKKEFEELCQELEK